MPPRPRKASNLQKRDTELSLTLSTRPTIVDRFVKKSLAADVALIAGGAALTAAAAQVQIPMVPVPITGQTFAVLLVGAAFGLNRAALSMVLYVILGVAGLPVFTGAKAFVAGGPTMGYLAGFIAAAALVGYLAQREWDHKWFGVVASFVAGNLVIYAFGLTWLSVFLGTVGAANDLTATLNAGMIPFLIGDAIKIALAAVVLPLAWKIVKR